MEEVDGGDGVALDPRSEAVVSLWMNVMDRRDVELAFHWGPLNGVEASFCTCVDEEEVDYLGDGD